MTISIFTFIISIVGIIGGFIMGYIKLTKLQKDNEYSKVINLKIFELQQLKVDNKSLQEKIDKLNVIVKDLDIAIIRLKSVNLTYPFPFMLKDKTGRIILVNDEWARVNNKTKDEVIGKIDYQHYASAEADKFKASDLNLINSPFGFTVEKDELLENSIVIKWRVQGLIQEDIYIAVISVPAQTLVDQCKKKT